jgi:hypothetical protein
MLSKSTARATALVTLIAASCATPWHDEPVASEVNLAFTLKGNLIELSSIRIGGQAGRFLLGTAAPRTVVSESFRPRSAGLVILGERESVRVSPAVLPLGGVADAIVGGDVWQNRAVTIDYHSGLVTWQLEGIHAGVLTIYRFPAEPMIEVNIDGTPTAVILDTSSPDTLVIPSRTRGRRTARVRIGEVDFGAIDVRLADVSRPRIGNRLLSKFLVTVDYGRNVVGLWRDPRIPIAVTR